MTNSERALREVLAKLLADWKDNVKIMSKSRASTYKEAARQLEAALNR